MAPYTHGDFRGMLLSTFPELREQLEDWDFDYSLHFDMEAFARHAQRAKGQGDWQTYSACIQLAEKLWQNADSELSNAIGVSFLEQLDFEGPRGRHAWSILPPVLQTAWQSVQKSIHPPVPHRKKRKK